MEAALARAVDAIHASGRRAVFEFAGAGAVALAWLHGRAGSSRTVLEASDRYAPAALAEAAGFAPARHASPEVAEALASAALARACTLDAPGEGLCGLGWSAALAAGRRRRGAHRCHLALCDASGVSSWDLLLDKGRRTREEEERLVGRLALKALGEGLAECEALALPLGEGDRLARRREALTLLARLGGAFAWVRRTPDGASFPGRRLSGAVLLCGSFNPLHEGHRGLAAVAGRLLGREPLFELGLANADKTPFAEAEAERRAAQFRGYAPVLLTAQPRFVDKARWMRDCVFVVGADTALRVVDPRFYAGDRQALGEALARIRESGCRFLVAARLDRAGGRVESLADCAVPRGFERLFEAIPAADFRVDRSSTELRERGARAGAPYPRRGR